jgi:acid phosphatase
MMLTSALLTAALSNVAVAAYTFDPLEHLAGIAPYFEDPVLDPKAPQGCNVTKATMLVRHAAITGNDFDWEEYIEPFVEKLGNTTVDWRSAGPLAFLAKWQTPISDEELEDLTIIGRLEAYKLGVDVRLRYPGLKDPSKVWTSTAERTEMSSESFIDGLVAHSNNTERVSVEENKAAGADSLTPYKGCPKYSSSYGSNQSAVSCVSATHRPPTDRDSNIDRYTQNPSLLVCTARPQASISQRKILLACKY